MEITDTRFYSQKIGRLSKGCSMCVKGEKLVMFATGICPRRCWYCPLSDKKQFKDVVYANEWHTSSDKDIIQEAILTNAMGAGFTGGDPIARLTRTIRLIKLLKKNFSSRFHIHLYTSFDLVTGPAMAKLHEAGLDEIRFHPDIENPKLWDRINHALPYDWDIGIEIPVIPHLMKETRSLIDFFSGKIKFINLNELEVTETNSDVFKKKGLRTKSYLSQGIKGSEENAKKLLSYCLKKNINTHFCTAKLKDKVQLKNRLKRRAKSMATPFDEITSEGLLIRPAIYGDMKALSIFLWNKKIPFFTDNDRAIVNPLHLKKHLACIKKNGFIPAIVEEYPTHDKLAVTIDYL